MRVAVIGTGYVGLVSGSCLAELGHEVVCVDIVEEKIEKLRQGVMPIFEPGLEEIVARAARGDRLRFTTSFADAIPGTEVVVMAIGTPSAEDGSVDMSAFDAAVASVAQHVNGSVVIADKSTVPVGTAERVETIARAMVAESAAEETRRSIIVDVVSNPEFLREGQAVYDFLNPSRVIIGSASPRATDVMLRLYSYLDCPKIVMERRSAELTKYAANAFLATKISFINEIAHLAEDVGADIEEIAHGIGSDPRIGKEFLRAGIGWGGSCFPKDVRAIMRLADQYGHLLPVIRAAHVMNRHSRERVVERIERALGFLQEKKIAVLGLAFKGNTDDMRESASIDLISRMLARGAHVTAYDPVADIQRCIIEGGTVNQCADPYAAAEGAHAVLVATGWDEFRTLDLRRLHGLMAGDLFVDARNLFTPAVVKQAGLQYLGVGRGGR